jgi:hypothetical protein
LAMPLTVRGRKIRLGVSQIKEGTTAA